MSTKYLFVDQEKPDPSLGHTRQEIVHPKDENSSGGSAGPVQTEIDIPSSQLADEEASSQKLAAIAAEIESLDLGANAESVRRIRERDPRDLQQNFARAEAALTQVFEQTQVQETVSTLQRLKGILRRGKANTTSNGLQQKAARFSQVYQETVFNQIEHTAPDNLPDELTLKSPAQLAHETGRDLAEVGVHSGDRDTLLGNTDYVFANFNALPSKSFVPEARNFHITSEDAYVVPVDISDMKPTPHMLADGPEDLYERSMYTQAKIIDMYADNIFTLQDFKQYMALYSATFFDSPSEAVDFFTRYTKSKDIERGDFWDSDYTWASEDIPKDVAAKDKKTLNAMKSVLETSGIYPPFAPEIQYKNQVAAKRK